MLSALVAPLLLTHACSVQAGPARTLLHRWAPQSRNLVLFPSTAAPDATLARRVLEAAAGGQAAEGVTLRFTLAHRDPLEVRMLGQSDRNFELNAVNGMSQVRPKRNV